jgi:uncharacterized protein involved in exopolysaccharide biosynthesis
MNNGIPGSDDYPSSNGHDADGLPPRIHFYDYLIVLAQRRWTLLSIILGGTALVAIYVMVMPQIFTSAATLLPPDKSEGVSLGSFLKAGEAFDLKSFSENSSAEIFVKILQSRTLADSLVTRLDLLKKYDLTPDQRQLAVMIFQGGLDVSSDRQGLITIAYNAGTGYLPSDREKQEAGVFAANVANTAIDILDKLNREKSVSRARRSREFIGRMKQIKRAERDSAQLALLQFQTRNKAISLDKQVEASITGLVDLQTQIQKKELELGSALNDLNPDTKIVENLRSQIAQLRGQYQRLEAGQTGGNALALPLRNVPDLARQYATLKLDLEVATQVYTFLETQYNQEQVQEARDLPTISVLDPAQPPLYRSAPRRAVIVAVAFAVLTVASCLLIFLFEGIRKYWRLNDSAKAAELRDVLRRKRNRTHNRVS